jgi:hypothetical protein
MMRFLLAASVFLGTSSALIKANDPTVNIQGDLRRDPGFSQRQSEQIQKGMTVDEVTAILGCPSGDYTGGKGCYVAFIDPFPVAAFRRQFAIHWCGHQGAIGLVLDKKGKVKYADWYPPLDPENRR